MKDKTTANPLTGGYMSGFKPTILVGAMLLSSLLASCGGGGGGSSAFGGGQVPYTGAAASLRTVASEYFARKAVNYSPFRSANRDTETPTAANVLQDMQLLIDGNFRLIRLFDSGDQTAKLTLETIRDNNLDIKVMLGVWINAHPAENISLSPAQNQAALDAVKAANYAEVARGVALANDFCPTGNTADASCIVLTVSVGNEKMVSWSPGGFMQPAELAPYITAVRDQIKQPVTTDDDWAFWAQAGWEQKSPTPVLDAIDFVSMHTYPLAETIYDLWDWKFETLATNQRARAMMDGAIAKARANYQLVRANLDRHGRENLPIVIGETGWKAENSDRVRYRSSPINQAMYYADLAAWLQESRLNGGSGPSNIFYFEAFDEPWKGGDDKWGLFNVARQARCVVRDLSGNYTPAAGSCDVADANYWKEPIVNAVVTTENYRIYAENALADETLASVWQNPWDGTVRSDEDPTSAAEGTTSKRLTPQNTTNWGWGMSLAISQIPNPPPYLNDPPVNVVDLSRMGYINFSARSNGYPGKFEVGFSTDTSGPIFIQIGNGDYGYMNDDAWHQVKIPLQAIINNPANGAGGANANLQLVTEPFMIADRFLETGKALNTKINQSIYIDGIYWSAN